MVEEMGLQYDDDNKLIIFICQVLEYQPGPLNKWTTVGQLETGRWYHAVLSIGSEALPCLQGCLKKDKLFIWIAVIVMFIINVVMIFIISIIVVCVAFYSYPPFIFVSITLLYNLMIIFYEIQNLSNLM